MPSLVQSSTVKQPTVNRNIFHHPKAVNNQVRFSLASTAPTEWALSNWAKKLWPICEAAVEKL